MTDSQKGNVVLAMNTLAFTICFMCWMMNGVLITYLVDHGIFRWTPAQMGWLIGTPVLTGHIGKSPDIAEADSETNRGHEKSKA